LLSSKKEKLLKIGGSHTNGKINCLTYFGLQAGERRIENNAWRKMYFSNPSEILPKI